MGGGDTSGGRDTPMQWLLLGTLVPIATLLGVSANRKVGRGLTGRGPMSRLAPVSYFSILLLLFLVALIPRQAHAITIQVDWFASIPYTSSLGSGNLSGSLGCSM